MKKNKKIPLSFYRHFDVTAIAKSLLGKELFTKIDGHLTGGIITETEAYAGVGDRASHAYNNRRTARTEVMYQKGGVAYVYLCYGIHCLLNAVTASENIPHAVLIRAISPTTGVETMLKRRKKSKLDASLTSGPGALTAALGIDLRQNGVLLNSDSLCICETDLQLNEERILIGPRIGIDYAGNDAFLPFRFRLLAK